MFVMLDLEMFKEILLLTTEFVQNCINFGKLQKYMGKKFATFLKIIYLERGDHELSEHGCNLWVHMEIIFSK